MYTRCPSCRAEISFEPPANAANLPEGYKHRIKCPSCGVTIGVKIPRVDTTATVQPTYYPANPNATAFEPVYQANAVAAVPAYVAAKPAKKAGTMRNIFMLIFSLAFIIFSVLGYLVNSGAIADPSKLLQGFDSFTGIFMWEAIFTEVDIVKFAFEAGIVEGLLTLIPLFLFTFACIDAIVAIIALFIKKYSRVFNLLVSIIIAACACICMFLGFIAHPDAFDGLGGYIVTLISEQSYMVFVGAGIGVCQLIFSLFFLKSLKRKAN